MVKYCQRIIYINNKNIKPKGKKGNFYETKSKNPYFSACTCDVGFDYRNLRNPRKRGE